VKKVPAPPSAASLSSASSSDTASTYLSAAKGAVKKVQIVAPLPSPPSSSSLRHRLYDQAREFGRKIRSKFSVSKKAVPGDVTEFQKLLDDVEDVADDEVLGELLEKGLKTMKNAEVLSGEDRRILEEIAGHLKNLPAASSLRRRRRKREVRQRRSVLPRLLTRIYQFFKTFLSSEASNTTTTTTTTTSSTIITPSTVAATITTANASDIIATTAIRGITIMHSTLEPPSRIPRFFHMLLAIVPTLFLTGTFIGLGAYDAVNRHKKWQERQSRWGRSATEVGQYGFEVEQLILRAPGLIHFLKMLEEQGQQLVFSYNMGAGKETKAFNMISVGEWLLLQGIILDHGIESIPVNATIREVLEREALQAKKTSPTFFEFLTQGNVASQHFHMFLMTSADVANFPTVLFKLGRGGREEEPCKETTLEEQMAGEGPCQQGMGEEEKLEGRQKRSGREKEGEERLSSLQRYRRKQQQKKKLAATATTSPSPNPALTGNPSMAAAAAAAAAEEPAPAEVVEVEVTAAVPAAEVTAPAAAAEEESQSG
jgi:hypothetical protein